LIPGLSEGDGAGRLGVADAEREAQLLSKVIETISAGLDLDRILQGVAQLVTETTETDVCFVHLLDEHRVRGAAHHLAVGAAAASEERRRIGEERSHVAGDRPHRPVRHRRGSRPLLRPRPPSPLPARPATHASARSAPTRRRTPSPPRPRRRQFPTRSPIAPLDPRLGKLRLNRRTR